MRSFRCLRAFEHKLQTLQNDCEVPDVIRIAAQAVLIMVGALTDDCEVYCISISESQLPRVDILLTNTPPSHGNPDSCNEDHVEARKVIIDQWTESYALPEVTPDSTPAPLSTMTDSDTINAEVGRRGSLEIDWLRY